MKLSREEALKRIANKTARRCGIVHGKVLITNRRGEMIIKGYGSIVAEHIETNHHAGGWLDYYDAIMADFLWVEQKRKPPYRPEKIIYEQEFALNSQ